MVESTELETQKQIYILISKEPGLHISKIAELLRIDEPLALYHLRYLEKHELVTCVREEGYTRYYLKGEVGIEDRKLLSLLRQEIPLRIILFLLQHPGSSHKVILEQFDIAKSTLSYHLKKLVKRDIIVCVSIGDNQGYSVVNESNIIRCLLQYKPSRVVLGLKDTWVDFTVRK